MGLVEKGYFGTLMSALGPSLICLFNFVNIYQLDLVKNEIEFCIFTASKKPHTTANNLKDANFLFFHRILLFTPLTSIFQSV